MPSSNQSSPLWYPLLFSPVQTHTRGEEGVGDEAQQTPFVASLLQVINMVPYKGANIEVQGTHRKVFNQTCSSLSEAKQVIDNAYNIIKRSIK